MQENLLLEKRALITGGSRGLGRALCLAFARAGARVAFSYERNQQAADEVRQRLGECGCDARAYRVSVTDVAATEGMTRDLEVAWGGIDILVNNAAITQNLPLVLLNESDWDAIMNVNVKGPFVTTKAVLRGMIRRRSGVILNIGSLAGERAIEAPVHYCASKAALRGFTEALAKEMGRNGIRTVCLAPGLLEDGIGQNVPEHRLTDYIKHCAMKRVGTFDEVARFAALLVSDAATYINGATIVMDGGL